MSNILTPACHLCLGHGLSCVGFPLPSNPGSLIQLEVKDLGKCRLLVYYCVSISCLVNLVLIFIDKKSCWKSRLGAMCLLTKAVQESFLFDSIKLGKSGSRCWKELSDPAWLCCRHPVWEVSLNPHFSCSHHCSVSLHSKRA